MPESNSDEATRMTEAGAAATVLAAVAAAVTDFGALASAETPAEGPVVPRTRQRKALLFFTG